jgi:acetoacetyl-CoA reductase
VVPGGIETDMVAALPEDILKAAIDLIPMHALGKPGDVAEAVRYLVSDEAHYLTGTLLTVAGGLLMM